MAKSKKRSAIAVKAWVTRRKNAKKHAKKEPRLKINMSSLFDYKPLDSPLLEIPEPGPAVVTMGTEQPPLNLREIAKAMDKLVGNFYSILG